MDSEMGMVVVNRIVTVPHNCHKNHNMAGPKYDHRIKKKVVIKKNKI